MFLPIKYQPFHLALTLTMGQALRWRMEGNGWLAGVVRGKLIKLRQVEDRVEYQTNLPDDSDEDMLRCYLRLDQDIEQVHNALLQRSPELSRLVELYGGIRVLRQEPWEGFDYLRLIPQCPSRKNRSGRGPMWLPALASEEAWMTYHSIPFPRHSVWFGLWGDTQPRWTWDYLNPQGI